MLCEALMVFVKHYLSEWCDENAFSVTLGHWMLLAQLDRTTELKVAVLQSNVYAFISCCFLLLFLLLLHMSRWFASDCCFLSLSCSVCHWMTSRTANTPTRPPPPETCSTMLCHCCTTMGRLWRQPSLLWEWWTLWCSSKWEKGRVDWEGKGERGRHCTLFLLRGSR